MDSRDLDRVVSKTSLTPLTKVFLRRVRKSVDNGDVSGFRINKNSWTISVVDRTGFCCTYVFTFRKENGNKKNL